MLYPRVMHRSIDVSPQRLSSPCSSAGLLGVLGALLAIPIAAAMQLLLAEVIAPRQDAS